MYYKYNIYNINLYLCVRGFLPGESEVEKKRRKKKKNNLHTTSQIEITPQRHPPAMEPDPFDDTLPRRGFENF
jgi:hypothetical protein